MATLESKLRVSLLDDVSAKARKITGALAGLGKNQREMMAPFSGLTAKLVAFGGAYFGVNAAIENGYKPAADLQAAMTEIGIKADLSTTQLAQMQNRLVALAPKVNQTTAALTGGVDTMLTMGLAARDAQDAIPAVGKAATATGAAIEDLSSSAVSAIQNLKVAPNLISQMFDGMATAGNAGAVEIKDMAQYFPQLTASARKLHMEGVPAVNDMAAALQIARRGAGDASTAANNMSNFMSNIMTPQTIKNFKKFGVDVTKELDNAHKKGISPIEHFIKLIDEKTKGGKADLISQIFGDKQTIDFIAPMVADFKDYIKIRNDADKATGTIDQAFARRMQNANEKIKAFQIGMQNLGLSIGANFLKPIGDGAQYLANILDTLDDRVTILDKVKASATGFLSGLGIGGDDFKSLSKDIEAFFFGSADASKAADDYARIFGRFREWGSDVRSLYDSVAQNPLVKFFADLSPYGVKLMLWGTGIVFLAGTVRKLASALMFLSGASTLIGTLKTLSTLAGLVGPGAVTTAATGGGAGGALAGMLAAVWKKVPLAAAAYLSTSGNVPEDPNGGQKLQDTTAQLQRDLIASRAARRADTYTGTETQLNAQRGFGYTPIQAAVDGSNSPIRINAESIAEMNRPTGIQQVQVTNMERPNVTITNSFSISGALDPRAIVDAAAKKIGEATKAAVEGSYGGGGGF